MAAINKALLRICALILIFAALIVSIWWRQPAGQSRAPPVATVFPSTSGEQHETVKSDVHPKPGSTASSAASAVRSSIYIDTHALVICRQALLRLKNVESMDFDCDVMPPFSKEQSICKYQRTKINQQLPELKAKAASCPANVLNAQDFYVALRDNALSGDTEAQRCYILGIF